MTLKVHTEASMQHYATVRAQAAKPKDGVAALDAPLPKIKNAAMLASMKDDRNSKKDRRKIQEQLDTWGGETGLPLTHLSRICAMSIGENYDAAMLRIRSDMVEGDTP